MTRPAPAPRASARGAFPVSPFVSPVRAALLARHADQRARDRVVRDERQEMAQRFQRVERQVAAERAVDRAPILGIGRTLAHKGERVWCQHARTLNSYDVVIYDGNPDLAVVTCHACADDVDAGRPVTTDCGRTVVTRPGYDPS